MMEEDNQNNLSVEASTTVEEQSSTCTINTDTNHCQQQQYYSCGSDSTPLTPRSITLTDDNNGFKWWFKELHQLPKEIRNIIAGGFAGMIAKSVVAPFDRIKILYQVSSVKFQIVKLPGIAKHIIQDEGLQALWKGNTATLIRVFPYSGIQFMVFDRCKTYILHEQESRFLEEKETQAPIVQFNGGLSPLESLFAGMTAGAVSVIATYPLDLTRAQLAVLKVKKGKSSSNDGFGAALLRNFRDRGVIGLFRGITPTLMGILPYSGLAFSFNEQAKRKIQNMKGRDLTTIERMKSGALSGLFAQTITYPLEVTRRRMQIIGIVATSGKNTAVDVVGKVHGQNTGVQTSFRAILPDAPPSMCSIIKELYKEQGIRGFFKGVTLNWFKGPIAFSISFTVFDIIQSSLATDTEQRFQYQKRTPRLST